MSSTLRLKAQRGRGAEEKRKDLTDIGDEIIYRPGDKIKKDIAALFVLILFEGIDWYAAGSSKA